jgi:hypothetical protein
MNICSVKIPSGRSAVADWYALVQHWKASHGQLQSGLPASGTVIPEGGTTLPKESPIRSMSNADWNKLLEHWSLSPEDGQLLYGLAAAGNFNPESGTAMPKVSPISLISNVDWNRLMQQWKVSHGHLLSNLPAGGTFNP